MEGCKCEKNEAGECEDELCPYAASGRPNDTRYNVVNNGPQKLTKRAGAARRGWDVIEFYTFVSWLVKSSLVSAFYGSKISSDDR